MIALVFLVSTALTESGVMFSSSPQSANTGTAPRFKIGKMIVLQQNVGTITSSPAWRCIRGAPVREQRFRSRRESRCAQERSPRAAAEDDLDPGHAQHDRTKNISGFVGNFQDSSRGPHEGYD